MSAAVLGREEELGLIQAFLDDARRGPATLVLCGEPGIGKTILWEAGVERARGLFPRVLSYRGVEAEARLSFAALADLLDDVFEEALPSLAAPRRRALEVALLLEEPGEQPPDPRAIGLAFLDVVRALAASGPLLVAVDDLQWLDSSSARAIWAGLRRLRDERVGLLATARLGPDAPLPFALEHSLHERILKRLPLQPLSRGALYQLLKERLGLGLTRPELVRLHDITAGNPFFALEMGRELARARARLAPGRPLPVPGNLRKLLGGRLARLRAETREVLLTAAALAGPTVEQLAAAHGLGEHTVEALEEAARAGVLELEDSRVRFSHPLLASVCYEEAPLWRRRAAHRRVAAAVAEVEERARHLALAANGPDKRVAYVLVEAANHAAARGATAAAAEFFELAGELTPLDSPERRRRRLAAANFHRLAGDRNRAGVILEELLAQVRRGPERADVLFALALSQRADLPTTTRRCEEALLEAEHDDARSAKIVAFLSWMRLREGDVRGALAHARLQLEKAERVGDLELLARAIARAATMETFACSITPGLVERGVEIERGLGRSLEFHESPTAAYVRRLVSLSELDGARALLHDAEARAAANGDEGARAHLLFNLTWLELFAGRWERALCLTETVADLAEQLGDEQLRSMILTARATVDAHLGRVDEARAAAEEARVISAAAANDLFRIWDLAALGHLELSLGNLRVAERHLRPLPARLVSLGWNDPVEELWPDTIEVLIALGELTQARSYLGQFEVRAQQLGGPWALAAAARCRGLLAAAEGDLAAAFEAFERALAEHGRMQGTFECGRTLLALGSTRRRAKQKRAAREALEQALALFEELGARLWAAKAREELARIGGRRPASKNLTETERRVASLAAEGHSNKEIAAALFVSVHTVEAHLSRIYRKLEIRSRAELGRRIAASEDATIEDTAAKV
jgi:DNA-binding CsgD family transcriptional regulator